MTTWLPVPDLDGYEASDDGRVRSLKRGAPKLLATSLDDWGYRRVSLWVNGRVKVLRVHQLVCMAFHGPQPEGLQVRHINGDQLDNVPSNLHWGTPAENMQDRIRHGRNPKVNQTHCKRGHELTAENTYDRPGVRQCKTCTRMHSKVSNAKAKQKRDAARANKSGGDTVAG